jgi:hypothetical protein
VHKLFYHPQHGNMEISLVRRPIGLIFNICADTYQWYSDLLTSPMLSGSIDSVPIRTCNNYHNYCKHYS